MTSHKMKGLICRECGKEYPAVSLHVCELCFGPLEVQYNYTEIRKHITRRSIEAGPKSLWRYKDLLPVATPNVQAVRASPDERRHDSVQRPVFAPLESRSVRRPVGVVVLLN